MCGSKFARKQRNDSEHAKCKGGYKGSGIKVIIRRNESNRVSFITLQHGTASVRVYIIYSITQSSAHIAKQTREEKTRRKGSSVRDDPTIQMKHGRRRPEETAPLFETSRRFSLNTGGEDQTNGSPVRD